MELVFVRIEGESFLLPKKTVLSLAYLLLMLTVAYIWRGELIMPAKPKIMVPMVMIVGLLFFLSCAVQSKSLIQVRSGHPRIFITPSTLPYLKARAAGSHNDVYVAIKAWCDTNWNNISEQRSLYYTHSAMVYEVPMLQYALIYILGEIAGSSYSVHSINGYGDKALAIINHFVTQNPAGNPYALPWVATAYDWISMASPKDGSYRMDATAKANIVRWFYTMAGDTPTFNTKSPRGYMFITSPFSLWPGLAFYGDGVTGSYGGKTADQLAQTYVDWIPTYLLAHRALMHESGVSGGMSVGLCGYGNLWYTGTGYLIAPAFDLYAVATATDVGLAGTFNTYSMQKTYPIAWMYNVNPGPTVGVTTPSDYLGAMLRLEDCGTWKWTISKNDAGLATFFRLISHIYVQNGETANAQLVNWIISDRLGYTDMHTTFDLLFNDRTTAAVSPTTLGTPKVKAFGWDTVAGAIEHYDTALSLPSTKAGMGEVIMQSDWSTTGSYFFNTNTTYAMFRAFPYYYHGHQHFDSLNFSIFKGDTLVVSNAGKYYYHYEGGEPDSGRIGTPHHWHYYDRIGSNIPLILDPSEQIIDWYGTPPAYHTFKDGGQRTARETAVLWGDVVDGVVSGKEIRDWGGLIKFEDATNYTYVSADATKGYNSTVDGVNYVSYLASPKTTLVQRDFVYSKSSDGNSDYFVVFDRINSISSSHKKAFLLHTIGEPKLYNGANPATISVVHGNASNGILSSTNTDTFRIKKSSGAVGQLFLKTLLPSSTTVYKAGGSVTTTTTQAINNTDGATIGGARINIGVTSTAEFSTVPTVVIDYEVFMCDGKTANQLTGCIRGPRYDKHNPAVAHNSGATVTQVYTWVNREVDTGNWISYPHDYGDIHSDGMVLKDADEFGRWSLRIESGGTENNTNFLHVLFPTTNLSQVMPETILINSTSGNMKGALIKDPVNPRIVMLSPTTAQISDVTYDAKYLSSQTAKHLMTGLVPSAGYDIYRNGSKVTSSTASSQGIIYFESTGGATFRLVQTSGPIRRTSDTTPPSTPTNLSAGAVSSSQINLSWTASNDNVGVTGYRIYRNGSQIATSTDNSY